MAKEETVTKTDVTDEDLEAAFAEATGKGSMETTETVETETTGLTEEQKAEAEATKGMTAEELEEHKEKSKLGRKFKGLEERFNELQRKVETGTISKESPTYQAPQEDEAELERIRELYREDPIAAKRAQDTYERKIAETEAKAYEGAFLKQINTLSQEDPDLHAESFKELMEHYNVRLSNDPVADAERNYARAKIAVLKRSTSDGKVRPNTAGGKVTPVGPAARATTETTKTVVLPDLSKDPATRDYVAYLKKQGVKDEEIAKSFE